MKSDGQASSMVSYTEFLPHLLSFTRLKLSGNETKHDISKQQ